MTSLAARTQSLGVRQRLFPNTSLLGFYDPFSQTVSAPAFSSKELDDASKTRHFGLAAGKFLPTAIHEVTHWLDHTSTLWGQTLLIDIHRAIHAYHEQNAHEFWRVASLNSRMRREELAQYYTTIDQPNVAPGNASTWSWKMSCGLEFGGDGRLRDDRPIVFITFFDAEKKRIARVPFAVASLLEASAMWSEIAVHREIIRSLPPVLVHGYGTTVAATLHEEVYLPELTLYSAAAHFVASVCRITDPALAFEIAAALASVALNIGPDALKGLRVDDELRQTFGARIEALIKLRDPGFVFVCLCRAAPSVPDTFQPESWLDQCCRIAGLPSTSEIAASAHAAMSGLNVGAVDGKLQERLETLLAIGRRNAKTRGVSPVTIPTVAALSKDSSLEIPPIALADDRIVAFPPRTIDAPLLQVEPSLDMADAYLDWSTSFLAACRT